MKNAGFGNKTQVLWPNFLEQAMTIARKNDMVDCEILGRNYIEPRELSELKSLWKKKNGFLALSGGKADGIAYCMLTGKSIDIARMKKSEINIEDDFKYTEKEMNLFKYIKKQLRNKKYLTVGIDEKDKWIDEELKSIKLGHKTDADVRGGIEGRSMNNLKKEYGIKNDEEKVYNYTYALPGKHAYVIIGTEYDNGHYVVLKNPWNAPEAKGGTDISVPLKKFCQLFSRYLA